METLLNRMLLCCTFKKESLLGRRGKYLLLDTVFKVASEYCGKKSRGHGGDR